MGGGGGGVVVERSVISVKRCSAVTEEMYQEKTALISPDRPLRPPSPASKYYIVHGIQAVRVATRNITRQTSGLHSDRSFHTGRRAFRKTVSEGKPNPILTPCTKPFNFGFSEHCRSPKMKLLSAISLVLWSCLVYNVQQSCAHNHQPSTPESTSAPTPESNLTVRLMIFSMHRL